MSRHGKCRCGAMLTFRRRHGYKTRCAVCGKMVRLQPDAPGAEAALAAAPLAPASDELEMAEADIPMVTVVEEEEELPGPAVAAAGPRWTTPKPDQGWTWQWLAMGAGLVVWLGFLSVLAWWWWQ
jgi:hypothetical protein